MAGTVADLGAMLDEAAHDSIATKVVGRGRGATVSVFSVPHGESIPSHTNSNQAVAFILDGRSTVKVGSEQREVRRGSWIQFPPDTSHSLTADQEGFEMLLVVLESE